MLLNCATRFGPMERAATYQRLKRALAESEEAPAELVALLSLLSAPLAHEEPKPAAVSLAVVQRLYWACCPAAVAHLVRWRDEQQVLLLLAGEWGARPLAAAVCSGRLRRALRKGLPLSRPVLEVFLTLGGADAASWRSEGGDGALRPMRSCYELPGGERLVVESRSQYSTVAETMWPASLALAEAVVKRRLVEGKNVLELGSGIGLVGVAAMRWGAAKSVVMTDCSQEGLDLIRGNVLLNKCEADVRMLDWTDEHGQLPSGVEVVLIADCWYHQVVQLRDDQARLVARLLAEGGAATCWCYAADRLDGAVQLFREAFEMRGLRVAQSTVAETLLEERVFPCETALELMAFEITTQ